MYRYKIHINISFYLIYTCRCMEFKVYELVPLLYSCIYLFTICYCFLNKWTQALNLTIITWKALQELLPGNLWNRFAQSSERIHRNLVLCKILTSIFILNLYSHQWILRMEKVTFTIIILQTSWPFILLPEKNTTSVEQDYFLWLTMLLKRMKTESPCWSAQHSYQS